MTTVGEIEHIDRPRLTNGADPDTHDALGYYDSIIDAWQHRGRESVGTPMAVRACSTTKDRQMPVRRGHGTVIAGPRGIIYTPPTREERIRSMLDKLCSFRNAAASRTSVEARRSRRPVRNRAHCEEDLVYGANDGILTTFAVVAGVTGGALSATHGHRRRHGQSDCLRAVDARAPTTRSATRGSAAEQNRSAPR